MPSPGCSPGLGINSGNDLLSRKLDKHYHRRNGVSLPCSGWERADPPRKDHQTMAPREDSQVSRRPVILPIMNMIRERLPSDNRILSKPAIFNNLNLHEAYRRIKSRTNISSPELNALLRLYPDPINVVVFHGSSGRAHLGIGLALRCFQRLSFPNIAARRCS